MKYYFFIEEKKSFVELQSAAALINAETRPKLIGKLDEDGRKLLPLATQLEPLMIANAIAGRLRHLGIKRGWSDNAITGRGQSLSGTVPVTQRVPYFCSGCPHSRSTKVPDGSLAMAGIGCHVMTNFVNPAKTLAPTHMGGEGGNWMGMAPFSGTKHIFQNMGDGTYYHSGLMAIRAAIASGVNITYKILYNDAVAMTGGQPVDGPISVAEIAHQVFHEGAKKVIVVSDDPEQHRSTLLPPATRIEHRDMLEDVQRELREISGCTVLIYEQTCAAEKRRRRKRGTFPNPPKRLFISEAVCEGCGDCSVQSTCVSLNPVKTEFGTKRRIDQSSCNKDFSCLNGFCPSFITVHNAEPRNRTKVAIDADLFNALTVPPRAELGGNGFAMMVAGIGGTGVITVAAVLGMAAHLDGLAASVFDMTGLAQKNGAVLSHVRFAKDPMHIHAPKLAAGDADLVLAFDLVAALADDSRKSLAPGKTRALVNSDITPTVAFQFDRDAMIDDRLLMAQINSVVGKDAVETIDATGIATAVLGDSIATNFFLVGVAAQRGLLPVGIEAIERAIELNGAAIKFNLEAFRLGRLLVVNPDQVTALVPPRPQPLAQTLDAIVERWARHLIVYQGLVLAERYRTIIGQLMAREATIGDGGDIVTRTAAAQYGRVLAYKDEYEVARLLTSAELAKSLNEAFQDGARLEYNLAPPILAGRKINGRPAKRAFNARTLRPFLKILARMKFLRGSLIDPFSYTGERRAERALITHYEDLIRIVVSTLNQDNRDDATKLLGRVAMVRGYGPVKDEALIGYFAEIATHRDAFSSGAPLTNGLGVRTASTDTNNVREI
jgi:indolepyruvate ferredoxin oxidoreductase